MLILGRRENQSIVFPNCGITVRILDVNGRVAKVGIEAPRSVEIMRGELAATSATSGPVAVHPSSNSHTYEQACAPESESALLQFEQRLADIKSSLHIFQQLRAAGDEAKADTILSNLLNDLAHLDKDCLDSHVEQPESRKRIASELVSESTNMYDYSPAIGQSQVSSHTCLLIPTPIPMQSVCETLAVRRDYRDNLCPSVPNHLAGWTEWYPLLPHRQRPAIAGKCAGLI